MLEDQMTLKINMLAVAGALVLPAALMAQTTGSEMQPPVPTPPEEWFAAAIPDGPAR
jgi:hypothetical protein